jgi:hypothetical protein
MIACIYSMVPMPPLFSSRGELLLIYRAQRPLSLCPSLPADWTRNRQPLGRRITAAALLLLTAGARRCSACEDRERCDERQRKIETSPVKVTARVSYPRESEVEKEG